MGRTKSKYQIHCQVSRLLKRAQGTRRDAICKIARDYSHNISKHQIGKEIIGWREYEQLYTKEDREQMYYEQHPRIIYAGY